MILVWIFNLYIFETWFLHVGEWNFVSFRPSKKCDDGWGETATWREGLEKRRKNAVQTNIWMDVKWVKRMFDSFLQQSYPYSISHSLTHTTRFRTHSFIHEMRKAKKKNEWITQTHWWFFPSLIQSSSVSLHLLLKLFLSKHNFCFKYLLQLVNAVCLSPYIYILSPFRFLSLNPIYFTYLRNKLSMSGMQW